MKIPLVKNQPFNVPEGAYRSKVVSMYELKEKSTCKSAVKILFAPIALETKQEQPVVACEYCKDEPNKELVDDLNTILAGKFKEHLDEDGDFDEEAVEGKLLDIVVRSYHKPEHERPYTFVSAVFPPGTLNLN